MIFAKKVFPFLAVDTTKTKKLGPNQINETGKKSCFAKSSYFLWLLFAWSYYSLWQRKTISCFACMNQQVFSTHTHYYDNSSPISVTLVFLISKTQSSALDLWMAVNLLSGVKVNKPTVNGWVSAWRTQVTVWFEPRFLTLQTKWLILPATPVTSPEPDGSIQGPESEPVGFGVAASHILFKSSELDLHRLWLTVGSTANDIKFISESAKRYRIVAAACRLFRMIVNCSRSWSNRTLEPIKRRL